METSHTKEQEIAILKAAKRLSPVDIDKLEQRFLNVLKRESEQLLIESFGNKLSEESSKALVNYLKLLKQFRADELEMLELLDNEELEKMAKINKKNGDA